MELHSLSIKSNSKTTTLKNKTDNINAVLISNYLTSIDYKTITDQSCYIQTLKTLSRLKDSLVKYHYQILTLMTYILDVIFFEFKLFSTIILPKKTVFHILENYESLEKISRMNLA